MQSLYHHNISDIKQSAQYQDLYHCLQDHQYINELLMIGYISPYCHDMLIKYWHDIITDDFLFSAPQKTILQYFDIIKNSDDIGIIRQYKAKIFLLIAIMDYLALEKMEIICAFISQSADIICQRILHILLLQYRDAEQIIISDNNDISHGICIYAMGKLGANMLNYSSDIDLIFLYDEEKINTARHQITSVMRRIVNDFIAIMEKQDIDGRLFRVDIRLSPDNGVMPYAVSYDSGLNYYGSIARPWERMAMMKARVIAGDVAMGDMFLKEISPFIWRREIDMFARQEVSVLRQEFKKFYHQQISMIKGLDIKHCQGGIRDIEFAIQSLQMIWAGRLKDLKTPILNDILQYLQQYDLLSKKQVNMLFYSYWQLRRIEHHLQMKQDKQIYAIDSDDVEAEKLAYGLGYNSYAAFALMLSQLLNDSTMICNEFYDAPITEAVFDFSNPDYQTLVYNHLHEYGYENPNIIYHYIKDWYGYAILRSEKSRIIFHSLLPKILKYIATRRKYEQTIISFDHILSRASAGVQFFVLLNSQQHLLEKFCDLLTQLRFLSEQLIRDQGILDIIISTPISDYNDQNLDNYFQYTHAYARDAEEIFNIYIRKLQELRLSLSIDYLASAKHNDNFSSYLGKISDIAVKNIIDHAVAIYQPIPKNTGFVIIALGSWANHEMSLYSDLDMILIYDHDDIDDYDLPLYYNRLASRIIGYLQMQSKFGNAFHIDMRLRPDSVNVPLATSLERFHNYYLASSPQAWVAEYHALENARIAYASREISRDKLQKQLDQLYGYALDLQKLYNETKDLLIKTRKAHDDKKEQTYKQWIKELHLLQSYARRTNITIDIDKINHYQHILIILKHHYQFACGCDYEKYDFLIYCDHAADSLQEYLPHPITSINQFFQQLQQDIDNFWHQVNIII